MKLSVKIGSFVAALALVASSAFAGSYAKSPSIVEVASSTEGFSTLVTALKAANLVDTLQGDGPFTVFAPTDDAFAALPAGALEGLLADPEKLAQVLTLHVVAGKAQAADVVALSEVETVQGKSLQIDAANGVSVGGAKVIQADVMASNGVIHVIDRVLLP